MGDTKVGHGTALPWHGVVALALLLPLLTLAGSVWLAGSWAAALSPTGNANAAWYITALPLIAGVPAVLALISLSVTVVWFARRADAAGAALRAETDRRLAAEEALHQAQKMEAVGRLAGGIAHDFNNHLTAISSNVELLKRRLPGGTSGLERLADSAMQGVHRAATLSQRLLAFCRQQTPDPEPLDTGQIVAGMLDLLRRTLGEKIEIEAPAPARLWLTRVDAHQLESALLALAANARDAMPTGGRLTIEAANAALDGADAGCPADLAPGQYVTISMRDTGSRASMRDVDSRAQMTMRCGLQPHPIAAHPADEAGGFGLAIVYAFARQSGGFVRIETPVDQGTTVRLYLPRYVVPGTPVETSRDERHVPGAATTVLVVEDDETVRGAAAEALREIGYDVLEAPDAMEAVRLLADCGGVDLLFTDVGLPGGVNGRALADAARNIHPGLRVLFTTGYTQAPLLRDSLSAAEEHFLPKPFSLEQLEAKVRAVLGPPVGPPMGPLMAAEAVDAEPTAA
ncbi:MAG TPA: response regulator [Acetobacteraceae bacterium]|nr:response regulator [Acetobacteraceae bacterium]